MIDLNSWTASFLQALRNNFGDRIWFVGLQGSYGRGEATETSDLDMVVILDELSASDIQAYRAMLDTLTHRELICGFLAGKQDILNWEPSDLFQFYHDTTPIQGSLDELLPLLSISAIRRAVKIGVCSIFQGCVHNMLYERSDNILRGLYKSASFVVQAICYLQTGTYIRRQIDLLNAVSPEERVIVNYYLDLKQNKTVAFDKMSEALFCWSKRRIEQEDNL